MFSLQIMQTAYWTAVGGEKTADQRELLLLLLCTGETLLEYCSRSRRMLRNWRRASRELLRWLEPGIEVSGHVFKRRYGRSTSNLQLLEG